MKPLDNVRIRHREYITDVHQTVVSGDERTEQSWNPGMRLNAPWLSTIANSFEKYEIHSFAFVWVPGLPTSATGFVAIVPDYDPLDVNIHEPKAEVLGAADTVRASAWKSFRAPLDPKRLRKADLLYTRNGPPKGSADLRLYDSFGYMLMHNTNVLGVIGELWIEYDITLHIPQRADDEPTGAYVTFPAPSATVNPWEAPTTVHFNDCGAEVDTNPPGHGINQHLKLSQMTPGTYWVTQQGNCVGISAMSDPTIQGFTDGTSVTVWDKIWNAAGNGFSYLWKLIVGVRKASDPDTWLQWAGITATSMAATPLRITEAADDF